MKIAILVSGGVDSSVALRLLQNEGHDLTAFYLKVWLEDELSFLGNCPWEEDLEYVRKVCDKDRVPLKIISLQAEYLQTVVAYTIAELEAGRTPSPDILCNSRIKFGEFYKKISPDFEKVATGHYAEIEQTDKGVLLKRSPDPIKDQTYFLAHLNQDQLKRALFPIGGYTKNEVRRLAGQFDLPNKDRKDSQGICFLGNIKFDEFIKCHLGEKPGDILDIDTDKNLGTHRGFWYHTIGQRHGLKLSGGPWYVVKKDINNNIVFVSHKNTSETRKRDIFSVTNLNWISGSPPNKNELLVKIRHGEKLYQCVITGAHNRDVDVKLCEPDAGIAAGQFAIFYDGDVCLGCGVIS